jgi:hypothetical protein
VPLLLPEGSELREDPSHMLSDPFAGVTVWHGPHPALSSYRPPPLTCLIRARMAIFGKVDASVV